MAKNIRIVPASGSIYFTADGYDVTGSIRLQTVGSTEDVQFIDGKNNESLILIHKDAARVGIGTVSASAKWVIHVGIVGVPSYQETELPAVIVLVVASVVKTWPKLPDAVVKEGSALKFTVVVAVNPVEFATVSV